MLSLTWISAAPAAHDTSVSPGYPLSRQHKPPIQLRILKATELRKFEPSVFTAAGVGVHQQHKNNSVELIAIE